MSLVVFRIHQVTTMRTIKINIMMLMTTYIVDLRITINYNKKKLQYYSHSQVWIFQDHRLTQNVTINCFSGHKQTPPVSNSVQVSHQPLAHIEVGQTLESLQISSTLNFTALFMFHILDPAKRFCLWLEPQVYAF